MSAAKSRVSSGGNVFFCFLGRKKAKKRANVRKRGGGRGPGGRRGASEERGGKGENTY